MTGMSDRCVVDSYPTCNIMQVLENKFGLENCGNLEEPKNYEPDLKFEEERRRALDAAAEQYV